MNINDIAKLAGVSKAAVSRYLNDGYLSAEKREQIEKVIRQTGYKPSTQARLMRAKKSKFIGVVIPKINSESVSRMVAGISDVLADAGFQLLLANTANNPEREVFYLDSFREKSVDGIIFIATIFTPTIRAVLKSISIPLVIMGQELDGYSCVSHDDAGAAKALTALMLSKGRRHPGFLGVTPRDIAAGQHRRDGFLQALSEYGLTAKNADMRIAEFTMRSGYLQTRELLTSRPKIDCLFCATDSIAAGAIQYLKESGRIDPARPSSGGLLLTGFGDSSISSVLTPSLTTAHMYYKTAGQTAARLMLDYLKNENAARQSIRLGYEIIERESTALLSI